MRQLSGNFGARRKNEVKKKIRSRAGSEGTCRFALPCRLQTFRNRSGVERFEGRPVAHHFDLFDRDRGA